jgi:hypothetical protein
LNPKLTLDGARMAIDILDEVPGGLGEMMRYAEEMLIACTLIIEREVGPDEARDALKTAGKVLAKS